MGFTFENRLTDSAYIEGIARVYAETDIAPLCRAYSGWELIVQRYQGRTHLKIAGALTKAFTNLYPQDSEFLVIKFKPWFFMPCLPARKFVDWETSLPEAGSRSFWLHGAAWQYFDFDNVEVFLERLVRDQALICDPVVKAALQDQPQDVPARTLRHRFQYATGIRQGTIRQIERANHAAALLESGVSILDTVYQAGYADQPHMTRALKHFTGQTPAQLVPMHP